MHSLMKKIIILSIAIVISACSILSKTDDIHEYAVADKFITDKIFNTPEYHIELSPLYRSLSAPDLERRQVFDAYGYKIYLPWQIESETIRNEYVSGIYSPGNYVFIFDNPNNSTNSDIFMGMLNDFEEISAYRNVYKEYIKSKTNYDLVTASLYFTTNSISTNDPLNRKMIALVLLGIKSMYLLESEKLDVKSDPIYHFKTEKIKGYQVGDTIKGRWVRVALFPEDNEELNILLGIVEGFKVTQADIDFIIQNIEKMQ